MILKINGMTFSVRLADNLTSRALLKKLPLSLRMSSMPHEKYCYLKESLPSDPVRVRRIESGDLMLYGDGCIVVFYESFTTPYSYTRIGWIEDPDKLKEVLGKGSITIEFLK